MGKQAGPVFNRRPLFFAAMLFGAGVLVAYHLRLPLWAYGAGLVAAAAIAAACGLVLKKAACAAGLLYAALFFAGSFAMGVAVAEPAAHAVPPLGRQTAFTARVAQSPYQTDYGYVHVLDDVRLDEGGRAVAGRMRFVSPRAFPYNSRIWASCKIKLPSGAVNPGGYDERLNLLRRGIRYKAYAEDVRVVQGPAPDFNGLLYAVRDGIRQVVPRLFPEDVRGLALGMLLGDTSELSDTAYEAFRETGAAHILAVSGLNVGIIIFVFYTFLKLLRVGKKPRYFITLVFIAFYAALTGLGPSILRASVMAALVLTVSFFGQKTDALIVLSASFICILALSPLELLMPGFALTFGAVFGMVTAGGAIAHALKKWPKELRELTAANAGATMGTAPVLLSRFYSVSAVSLPGNFLIVPLSTFATVAITIAVPLGAVWEALAAPFAFVATGLMRIILHLVALLSRIPYASATPGALHAAFVGAALALMLAASRFLLVRPKVKRAVVIAGLVVFAVALVFFYVPKEDGAYLSFLDVGQGDGIFARTPSGVCFLVDGGDEWSDDDIANFLDYKGYALDFAVLTHPHGDHMDGLTDLIQEGRVRKLYTTEHVAITQRERLKNTEVIVLYKGDRLDFGEDFAIEVLHPEKGCAARDENDTSLVLRLRMGETSCLLLGDVSSEVEQALLPQLGKTHILKAAHHGSDRSSCEEMLRRVRPDYAVVSVGPNPYGQPGKAAIGRLERWCGNLYRTDENHAVEFFIGGTVRAVPMVP